MMGEYLCVYCNKKNGRYRENIQIGVGIMRDLKTKTEGYKCLGTTGFLVVRVHLKIETWLKVEMFESVRLSTRSRTYRYTINSSLLFIINQ